MKSVKLAVCLLTLSLMVAMLMGVGCSRHKIVFTGFLEDYSQLVPQEGGEPDFLYRKPGLDLGRYNKVMIDDVLIWYSPQSDYHGVHASDLQRLIASFKWSLHKALQSKYKIVEEPGADVLLLQAAITEVRASKPGLDHVGAALPTRRVASEIHKKITGMHLDVGSATLEAELLDSLTMERLVAIVDHREGRKTVVKNFDPLADAMEACEGWAYRLRQQLDMEHLPK